MANRGLLILSLAVFVPTIGNAQGAAGDAAKRRSAVGTRGADVPRPAPARAQSIPAPAGVNGVWLEYDGERWYSDGPAALFDPIRFTKVGDYHGFAVYRDAARARDIWVEVVKDGPVAPYTKR